MSAMSDCAGVILAGGASSRMGQDKSSLRLNGKSLLRHMQDLFTEAGVGALYISGPAQIPDVIRASGPLGGVHAVLRHVGTRYAHLLFAPVDMPGFTPFLMRRLIAAPANVSLVHYDALRMPFRLGTDRRFGILAESLLRDGKNVSVGHFQDSVHDTLVLQYEEAQASAFVNINTAEDWRLFRQKEYS